MTTVIFKKWNKILGWAAFAIALITYSLTVEPTLSFWDCGEYQATSSNLGVGHPPGAPLFQMLGAFFAMFSFGNKENISIMINMMSAFSSAFTILFMFWTISKVGVILVVQKAKELTKHKAIAIFGSAMVGALTFTFSDTFWFNAVETEVYAMATFLMSLMFWLGLKWVENLDNPRGNKWLVLIAFVIGLSFGVHFMGLLTIPAIGLLYFFKKYKEVNVKNFIIANIAAVAVLLFIFKLLLPSTLKFFGWMEVNIVNVFGLPFHSGTIIALLMVIAAFYYGLKYTRDKGYVYANTFTLCILFVFIGFSSWVMLPIRANAGTTINENNPSNARDLLAYYNLEQYPENPFFFGPQFTDQFAGANTADPFQDDKPKYEQDKQLGKYYVVNNYKDKKPNPHEDHVTFLPRMWSQMNTERYLEFMNLEIEPKPEFANRRELIEIVAKFNEEVKLGRKDAEEQLEFLQQVGRYVNVKAPSTFENFKFMFEYQLGFMYMRYLMWNFVGRQDDKQGEYNNNGNWISGIDFVDKILLGVSQENLPEDMKNNKGRNTYFFLPFILGIIGLLFVAKRDLKMFWVLLVFFLFTGLAIQVYTNVRPFEPRERDYSVVGSFYVFSIWVGFGCLSLYEGIKKFVVPKIAAPGVVALCLLAAPLLMASQNWDDHDRSGKYTALAIAKSYLDSCEPNAILFTIGDNDTFPLWYLQEVEGYRTDVKVIVTTYFATDWYIDQMKRKTYESDPVPSSLSRSKYKWGTRDLIFYQERVKDTVDIKRFVDYMTLETDEVKVQLENGHWHNTFPTKYVKIPVNKESAKKYVPKKYWDKIVPEMTMKINKSVIGKQNLLMLDILANNDWKRPIYFSGGSNDPAEFIWLKDYLQYDGLIYKLVPIRTPKDKGNPFDLGMIDTEVSYKKLMNLYWGGYGDDIYYDPVSRRNIFGFRVAIARVAEKLIEEGQKEKAEKLLDLGMEKMPVDKFELYTLVEPFIQGYYKLGKNEKARAVYHELAKIYKGHLDYYGSLSTNEQLYLYTDILTDLERFKTILTTCTENQDKGLLKTEIPAYLGYWNKFEPLMNRVSYGVDINGLIVGMYMSGLKKEGRFYYEKEVAKVRKSLNLVSKLPKDRIDDYMRNILIDLGDYERLLKIVRRYDDSVYYKKEDAKFNNLAGVLEEILDPGPIK